MVRYVGVKGKNASTVAGLIDDFYLNPQKVFGITGDFSSIPLKGAGEKATHIISIAANSAQSLVISEIHLKEKWDLYISKMNTYVESVRASAGKSLVTNGSDDNYPIGQAWFKATTPNLPSMIQAFEKLIKSYDFDRFIGMGQLFWNR